MLRRMRETLWPTEGIAPGARRAVNTLRVVVGVMVLAVALLVTQAVGESSRIDRRVSLATASMCSFYADLAAADSTLTKQSGELAVKLLADSRRIHRELRCPGRLPPPSRVLRELSAKHHVDLE